MSRFSNHYDKKFSNSSIKKQISSDSIFFEFEDQFYQENFTKIQISLECGATLYKTPIGWIQFGIPPGALVELNQKGIKVPQYYIIPINRFHKRYALSIADFQNVALYNFIEKQQKTYLICSPYYAEHLQQVFYSLYPTINQSDLNPVLEFYSSIDKNPIPQFNKEALYIKGLVEQYNPKFQFQEMIDFVILDKSDKKKMEVKLNDEVLIRARSQEYNILVDGQEVGTTNEKYDFTYVSELNWDEELKLKYNVDELLKIGQSRKQSNKNLIQEKILQDKDEYVCEFGVTFLPKLDTQQYGDSSLGFIIWIKGRGVIVDPPPFTLQILNKMHISTVLIEWIIITQGNSTNDQGAFQLLFENSNLELITSRLIYERFLNKYSYYSQMSKDFLGKILKFRPISIGAPLIIKDCRFKFTFNMGLNLNLAFTATREKQTIYFYGENIMDKQLIQKAFDGKVISQDRKQQLESDGWKNSDLIIMYMGKYSWENNYEDIKQIKDFEQIQEKIYFLTRYQEQKFLIKQKKLNSPLNHDSSNPMKTIRLQNQYIKKLNQINQEKIKQQELQQKIDLFCTIEIFENISIKNFRDLLQSTKEEYFDTGEYIIKQDTVGTKFYFVMAGMVCIFTNNRKLVRYCGTGSYFGEKALNHNKETRGANIIAAKPTILISLEKQDFWFIFGEERDEAGPIAEKLLSIQQSRQKDTVNLMRLNPILREFTEPQRQEIEMILKETKFDMNKIIWTKGDPAQFAIFIKSGSIKFSDCPEQVKPEMGEGYFIGEIDALLNEGVHGKLTTTLISLKKTEAFIIDKHMLLNFFKKNLGVLLKINYLKCFGPIQQEQEDLKI
ncbi:Cyclic nucleotide-binding protein [Pseudocohnilembus persalinus]|uniref:Cyclic nucleotide-binding protein n=1 Tax=Pseudocohnilembus persalinus TaxID=266149 RepID=A0A0V0QM40_PSEPJ|nr:Cyclic nucleotide-binding protein [Pseudocohnilembus persalinus]|eukprot:KRX03433.1 Cyclic nucleotide-binding protein [Pseudocohnilembus persalinus]